MAQNGLRKWVAEKWVDSRASDPLQRDRQQPPQRSEWQEETRVQHLMPLYSS